MPWFLLLTDLLYGAWSQFALKVPEATNGVGLSLWIGKRMFAPFSFGLMDGDSCNGSEVVDQEAGPCN